MAFDSQMSAGWGSHQYLGGAGARFHADRLGSGEQTGLHGISRRVGAHGEIAGGQSVEDEAAMGVRLGVAPAIARFQFHHRGDGRANAAGIVGPVSYTHLTLPTNREV